LKTLIFGLLLIASAAQAFGSDVGPCVPPPGFIDAPPPAIASADRFVAHTETIDIARNLDAVMEAVDKPLRDVLHSTSSLPGVAGDHPLTSGGFGQPGSRRLVCLTDGGTVEEQVLEKQRSDTSYHFKYEVWNYTTQKARPISFAVGDFRYSETAGSQTRIVWTYSFVLNRSRFPGYLGSLGDFLFRVTFLDRSWAEVMRNTLNGYKLSAEGQKALADK
jgi:hypothetical protein